MARGDSSAAGAVVIIVIFVFKAIAVMPLYFTAGAGSAHWIIGLGPLLLPVGRYLSCFVV
jgi:hypothetical protein